MLRRVALRYADRVPVSDVLATALLQRLRRLGRAQRTVLMRASVIGQRFRVALLSATIAATEDRVRSLLDEAGMAEFVGRESARGDWYAFRHALIRDMAYEELVGTRLRPVHKIVARALERCAESAEPALDDLAYHSWAARDASRCIRYNELAGDRAVAVFARADAQRYYTRALELARPASEHYRRLTSKLVDLHGDD